MAINKLYLINQNKYILYYYIINLDNDRLTFIYIIYSNLYHIDLAAGPMLLSKSRARQTYTPA